MNQSQANDIAWGAGYVRWYLYPYQRPIFDFLDATVDPFFESSRRVGKSTTKLVHIQERSRKQNGRVTFWAEPLKEQARNIVLPEMAKIQASCPDAIKAKFYRTDSFYEFPSTGARLYLLGINEDLGEGVRGRFAHEIVCDELGSFREADYVIDEVFRPMLLTTRGELTCLGTPPWDLGHLFYRYKKMAMAENRYIGRDFDCIDVISKDEKDRFIETMGGRNSTAVRRELYLEPVSDVDKLIIPEFNKDIHVVENYERPKHFTPYVGIDLGFNDFTAILFGVFDFETQTLIIEDEVIVNGKNSEEIVARAKAKELELWQNMPVLQRWSDNDPQQLFDMLSLFNYCVNPTRKDDKHAAIAALRIRFSQGKIKIHARCKGLILQIQTGLWANNRNTFTRTDLTGHLDAIDALIYLNRNVNERINPYNEIANISEYTHYIPKELFDKQAALPTVGPKPNEIEIGKLFGG